jgi:hypothetical protein
MWMHLLSLSRAYRSSLQARRCRDFSLLQMIIFFNII